MDKSDSHGSPGWSTLAVHGRKSAAGAVPVSAAGTPVVDSLVRSTIFHLDDEAYALRASGDGDRSRVYSRERNPTVVRVEERLACLEGAEHALLFSSGMAALHAILLASLTSGQNLVVARQLYGGNFSLLTALMPKLDVEMRRVDIGDLDALEAALDERTGLLLCESISNPLTLVADLPGISARLRAHAPLARFVVDASLATPVQQRPLEHGADLVLHSGTKYLSGHSDVTAGVVAGAVGLLKELWHWRTLAGACLDPEAAWLLERGLKTLALRLRAQAGSALHLARFLEQHAAVRAVHYCGLPGHPSHELGGRILEGCGGVLSFEVEGGPAAALALIRRLELFAEAASFGGLESLASSPGNLSQVALTEEQRLAAGMAGGLVRLAIGIEDVEDLERDLAQALT